MPIITPEAVGQALTDLQANAPQVQCLTNIVASGWTTNVLLAVGATAAMVDDENDAGEFAAIASAVFINLGAPYAETAKAMHSAAVAAQAANKPWVLDPVATGALKWRTSLAHELIKAAQPSIIRGSADEVAALGDQASSQKADPATNAAALATKLRCVVAVSGEINHLTDGSNQVKVNNGHPWMTKVSGMSCGLGALMAAFAGAGCEPLLAATSATVLLAVASEHAGTVTAGPGSFAVDLLDRLNSMTPDQLADRADLE